MITEKKDKTFMEKGKDFVKKHKWKIVAGVGLAAVGGIIYGVSKTSRATTADDIMEKLLEDSEDYCNGWKKLDDDILGIGTVTDLGINTDVKYVDAIVNDITVADIGKLGEGFMNIDGVTEDNTVSMSISVIGVCETE